MAIDPSIFRDYDIRAIVPKQLDKEGVSRIAKAIVHHFHPKSMQVGRDMRTSSPDFHKVFIETLVESGVNVVDLGLTSTDMLYFASGKYNEDLAINISASHNPPEYNGMKIVKKGAVAVSGNSGIYDIRDLAVSKKDLNIKTTKKGKVIKRDILDEFVEHVLSFIDVSKIKPFKVVVDTGNGMAGHFMPRLEKKLPWKVTRLYYELDGTFPNHPASPIEEKNRVDCVNKVRQVGADFGMIFDGDGDRVYLIDEKGKVLTGSVTTAIIAEALLKKNPKEKILYNAVVGRIVPETVEKNKGVPIRVKVGHTLIKEAMRKHNALFCGEHSGHYYFRENYYADSAIIAALLVAELLSVRDIKLSKLNDEFGKYPSTLQKGEINFVVKDKEGIMKNLEKEYKLSAKSIDWLDGISLWFDDFWVNIRPSNTEPLLRLNLEADNPDVFEQRVKEFVSKIKGMGGKVKE